MEVIIDRFEGAYAIVELKDGNMIEVPAAMFPGAEEGDVYSVTREVEKTKVRKKRIAALMAEVFKQSGRA